MKQSYAPVLIRMLLALAVGVGVGTAVRLYMPSAGAPAVDPATLHQPSSGYRAESAPSVEVARLSAVVLVAGATHDAVDGRIALPSGTRFQLRVASNRDGVLELHAINPDGVAEPVWSGGVRAGNSVLTPSLRLEGTRGLETLRLVLRTPGHGVAAQRQVQIWHL